MLPRSVSAPKRPACGTTAVPGARHPRRRAAPHAIRACEPKPNTAYSRPCPSPPPPPITPPHLARLNPEQRAAALHGDGAVAGPLLILAGVGTGKTDTLVHHLAHLVAKGADPRRILLMTFSHRLSTRR